MRSPGSYRTSPFVCSTSSHSPRIQVNELLGKSPSRRLRPGIGLVMRAHRAETEMITDLGDDLAVGHLVRGLGGHHEVTNFHLYDPLVQFVFGFTRPEEKHIGVAANCADDGVIEMVELARQGALLTVIGCVALRVLLDSRKDELGVLAVLRQREDKCFAMINPDYGAVHASALKPATTSKSSSSIELCRRRLSERCRSSETCSIFSSARCMAVRRLPFSLARDSAQARYRQMNSCSCIRPARLAVR